MNRRLLSSVRWSSCFTRRVAGIILATQVVTAAPVLAQDLVQSQVRRRTVRVNRTVPTVAPPDLTIRWSSTPTDGEITRLRFFAEPLMPIGRPTSPDENAALSAGLTAWVEASDRQSVPEVDAFLAAYPTSAWRASMLANLALGYANAGYYTRAMSYWDQAWTLAKDHDSASGRAVASYAVGQWLDWATKFGQVSALTERLADISAHPVTGPASQQVASAREGLRVLQNLHDKAAMFSGPEALKALIRLNDPADAASIAKVVAYHPTPAGTSLTELQSLGRSTGLNLRMEHRGSTAPVPLPSIVHLRSNHFSAVIRHERGKYLLRDVILGGDVWVDARALADESSGYVLVPEHAIHVGRIVDEREGATVVGHCSPGFPSPYDTLWEWIYETLFSRPPRFTGPAGEGPQDGGEPPGDLGSPGEPGGAATGGGQPPARSGPSPKPCGMPVFDFHPVTASLLISDVPLNCSTPRGPSVHFRLSYDHRESRQFQTFTYSNLGVKWTHNWLSYVIDNVGSNVIVHPRGAGLEYHQTFGATHQYNRTKLIQVSFDPARYERQLPDGTVEVFAQADRAASLPWRRVFLTEVIDPQGQTLAFTYDATFRLVAVEDALGRVTTLQYEHGTDPLKITTVTDPYGRVASMTYTAAGQLASITDTIGMASSFSYGSDDFIQSMTTPYGTSTFRDEGGYNTANFRRIEATDPAGGTERLEFWWENAAMSTTAPGGEVPTGFTAFNEYMNRYTSLYWDARAMAHFPGDATKATHVRWLFGADTVGAHAVSRLPQSVKRPLQSRVWYRYPDQVNGVAVGTGSVPSQAARVVDGGATQLWEATYNDLGHTTSLTDPLGRQTTATYATNQIDLLEVRQTGNGANDVLATFADYTSGHQPQTITDAAGEDTTITYNTAGQVLTVTNAKSETTTSAYDTDGFLQTVTGPVTGADTELTYDDYGRVATVTGSDGYTVALEHDALGRPTKVTYPDATFDQVTYEKLHVKEQRDRLGRLTTRFHDGAGRPTALRDPLGRMVQFDWCACGSLNALIDAKGQKTRWTRDVQGRVTAETRADGTTTTHYTYEPLSGRLSAVTDPEAQVTTHTYNLDVALQQVAFTNATIATPTISYTYDTTYPRTLTMVDAVGTTTYAYKGVATAGALGLASVDGPFSADTITYGYDVVGRVTSRLLAGTGTAVIYDPLGRISQLGFPVGNFGYTFEGHTGRTATVTYPNDQTTTYTYLGHTGDHRLQTIHHKNPSAATLSKFDYTYDAVGNIRTWRQERAGSAPQIYEFANDSVDQLTAAVLKDTNTTPTILKRQAWAYDAAGNRTVDQADDAVFASGHDNLNRLQGRAPGGPIVLAGTVNEAAIVTIDGKPATVDASNNFAGTAQIASGTTTVTLKAKDPTGNETTQQYEIDAAGSTTSYAYDANGNLTADGAKSYFWNALNQLVEVKQGTTTLATFVYDGAGRRTEKSASGVTHTFHRKRVGRRDRSLLLPRPLPQQREWSFLDSRPHSPVPVSAGPFQFQLYGLRSI